MNPKAITAVLIVVLIAVSLFLYYENSKYNEDFTTKTMLTREEKVKLLDSMISNNSSGSSTAATVEDKKRFLNALRESSATSSSQVSQSSSSNGPITDEQKIKLLDSLKKTTVHE